MAGLYANMVRGLALAAGVASTAVAQQFGVVSGTVADGATGRPVIGAIVRVALPTGERAARTDELGAFTLTRLLLGPATLDVRSIGYQPLSMDLVVTDSTAGVAVVLSRVTMLDTVRVRAERQGLYGAVARASDLRPLPNAELRVLGRGRIELDSAGRFSVPIKSIGSYFLRARAPGYAPQTVTVLVEPDQGAEVVMLLDSTSARSSNRLEFALAEFDDRMKRSGFGAALVTRTELLAEPNGDLIRAIRNAPSFIRRNLRFTNSACLFVDGFARATLPFEEVFLEDVEAVEVYASFGDATGTLENRWPPGFPCQYTGLPYIRATRDVVRIISIWTKP